VAAPTWTLRDAMWAMEDADVEGIAVCDGDRFVGVITAGDLVQLEQILHRPDS
jgi:CBS domain-containing protein